MGRSWKRSPDDTPPLQALLSLPEKLAVALLDRQVVDAGEAFLHQAVLGELPVLVAVRTVPLARIVVPFVFEAHGDAVLEKAPELLAQAVVEFLRPLAAQELADPVAPREEFRAVAPLAIRRVGERDAVRIARVPGILGGLDLLACRFERERRQWRSGFHRGTGIG